MEFVSHTQESEFHSPLADFDLVTEEIEVREDPLTDRTARIVGGSFLLPDEYDIDAVVSNDEGCFFCPDMVEDATPTYGDWLGTDRSTRGEAISFPNLNPYGRHSNVVVVTEDHFQPMETFTTTQLADALALALEFVHAVRDHEDETMHASVSMNFLRSAGSSLVHPHMQPIVDERGTNEYRRLLAASREYHRDNDAVYWQDLVASERDGERWIGSTTGVDWLAAFAPTHFRHVLGVLEEPATPDPDSDVVEGIADGLRRVLESYADVGLNAFNMALHLPEDEAMPPVMNVVARSVFDEYYWSDATFATVLHDQAVVETPPEEYAALARELF